MISELPFRHARSLAVAALAAILSACGAAESQPNGTHGAMPPPEVRTVTVAPRDVPVTFEYAGRTAGSREVEVRARVSGILLKRNYPEGAAVRAGQSLFTIDPAPFQAALARAEAELAAAEARHEKTRRDAERLAPLLEDRAISRKDYDDAMAAAAIAAAEVKAARARLTEARLNLAYTRVESPVTGIAGRALRSEGNYVTGPEVLLTTVSQIDPIHVLFGISDDERLKLMREQQAGRLVLPKNGQYEVSVRLAEGTEYARSGKLTFTDVRISGETGTSEARAELPNPDGLLRPGQFVRVTLKGARRPDAILVPQRAVLEGPQGKFVYVVNGESKAEPRPVQVGDWYEDQWLVTGGLAPGERVIVDGVMKIGPGAPVQVADAAEAPAQAPGQLAAGKAAGKPN